MSSRTVSPRPAGREEIPDTLLLLQHPPVVTMGKSGKAQNVLSPQALESRKIKVIFTDRGGDVTYHGPGPARPVSHSGPSGPPPERSRVCLESGGNDDSPPGLVRHCRGPDRKASRRLGRAGKDRRPGRPSLPLDQQTRTGPERDHRSGPVHPDQPLRDRPPGHIDGRNSGTADFHGRSRGKDDPILCRSLRFARSRRKTPRLWEGAHEAGVAAAQTSRCGSAEQNARSSPAPRAAHGLRRGPLPEPGGMLRPGHGHLPDSRENLHPQLHLLRDPHRRAPPRARPRRNRNGSPGLRPNSGSAMSSSLP